MLETGPKAEAVNGRWLVVEGCRSHACDMAAAFVVVDAATGGVKAWTTSSGRGAGAVEANSAAKGMDLPPEAAARLDAWFARLSAKGR